MLQNKLEMPLCSTLDNLGVHGHKWPFVALVAMWSWSVTYFWFCIAISRGPMNNINLVLDCICLFDNFFLTNELTKSMIFPFPVKKSLRKRDWWFWGWKLMKINYLFVLSENFPRLQNMSKCFNLKEVVVNHKTVSLHWGFDRALVLS